MTASAIYSGTVVHARLKPRRHHLRYRVAMLLLDLDELDELARRLRWFSAGRFNLCSFDHRDHGDGSGTPLRTQVYDLLRAHAVDWDGGPIRVLVIPRVLGYAFRPLTVYFCHDQDGGMAAVLYEVNNTFGERHSYLLPVPRADRYAPMLRQSCDKRFHVSPFLGMALRYNFMARRPRQMLTVAVEAVDEDGPVITTAFSARRVALTDRNLLTVFARRPVQGWLVIAAIHWEALKLWRKALALYPRPRPPDLPVSGPGSIRPPSARSPQAPRRTG